MSKSFWIRFSIFLLVAAGLAFGLQWKRIVLGPAPAIVWTEDGTASRLPTKLDPNEVVRTPPLRHAGRPAILEGGRYNLGTDINVVGFIGNDKLVSGGDDGSVRIWDVRTGQLLQAFCFPHEVRGLAVSPDLRYLAIAVRADPRSYLYVWDLENRGPMKKTPVPDNARSVAFSPDGKHLAFGGWRGACVLERATDKLVFKWERPESKGRLYRTNAVAFSPNGNLLAAAGGEIPGGPIMAGSVLPILKLWDWKRGSLLFDPFGHEGDVCCVAFSPEGHWLITGGRDCTVRVWDVATGKELQRLGTPMYNRGPWMISVAPDGKTLAVAMGGTREISIWDLQTYQEIRRRAVPDDPSRPANKDAYDSLSSVAFSPNGKYIVTGGSAGMVRIWDAATLREVSAQGGIETQQK